MKVRQARANFSSLRPAAQCFDTSPFAKRRASPQIHCYID